MEESKLNLVVAGTDKAVLMVESEADLLSEEVMLGAVTFGHDAMKAVAGAGSVGSSAGTYTACTEVIEPVLVVVMRSCSTPISSARFGW